jgi:membrane protease subunit (stomatin/prohibitin family)
MPLIPFVRNHSDLSTDRGFQFEFFCDRCGDGFRSSFQPSATGIAGEALETAGEIFGGLFGTASRIGDRVHSAAWEKAHDKAFARAVEEARPHFVRCPRCTQWVCRASCWNEERGLCKNCAPDVEVEMAAAQVEATIAQGRDAVAAGTYISEADKKRLTTQRLRATCPKCGAPLDAPAKFCPECGAPVQADKFCTSCGQKIPATARFCPECGAQQS